MAQAPPDSAPQTAPADTAVSPPPAGEDTATPRVGPAALTPDRVAERPESLSGEPDESFPETVTRTPSSQRVSYRRTPLDRIGGALLVGGGFEDFTDRDLRLMTGGGGSWNARALVGTRQFLGLEAAYVGAARRFNPESGGADLISNGVETTVRINLPAPGPRWLLEPFGFVGLGWQHYAVMNGTVATPELGTRDDDVMAVPMGAGLDFLFGKVMMDVRFTYRQTYFSDLLRATGGRLDTWGLSAQLGPGL